MNKEQKKKLMEEDLAGIPEVPEGFIEMVAEHRRNENVMWYRKKGGRATYVCGQCGAEYELHFRGRWKEIEEPVRDNQEKCRKCGSISWLKPLGKTKRIFNSGNYYLWQRQGDALICRIWEECRWRSPKTPERVEFNELGRAYYEPNKLRYYTHYRWDYYYYPNGEHWSSGKGYNQSRMWSGPTYGDPSELCKGTEMEHWNIDDYMDLTCRYHSPGRSYISIWDYMDMYEAWSRRPELEMMIKAGFTKIAKNIINRESRCRLNYRAKNVADFFRIYPERVRELKAKKGDDAILAIYQAERASKTRFSSGLIESIILYYGEYGWNLKQAWKAFTDISKYMTVQQAYNRVNGYYKTRKKKEWTKRSDVLREYRDYLNMRAENGYDMTNSVYLHPKNLKKAHNEMVKEQEERKSQERIQQVEKKYPKIRSKFNNLNKKWHYEGHGMVIRPARSAGEIVIEGQLQHHCVGRDTYLSRHDKGISFIFLLRKQGAEDKPYITIEINKYGIVQWYGAHDKKTSDKETLAAIAEFESKIKGNVAPREKVAV